MTTLAVAAWAESMGMSRQAGYQAVKRCSIPVVDGQVDVDVATTLYRKRTRAREGEKRGGGDNAASGGRNGGDDGYWESRARRERAEALLAELRLAEEQKELVRAADVRAALAKRASGIRESLLQIPARLSAVLAAESDAARCHELLEAELHSALAQLAEA